MTVEGSFIVTVAHRCKPGHRGRAIARIDSNGEQMAACPGFLFRYRMHSATSEDEITTVTGWRSEADYEGWLVRKKILPANPDGGESPYEGATNIRHHVDAVHLAPGEAPADDQSS